MISKRNLALRVLPLRGVALPLQECAWLGLDPKTLRNELLRCRFLPLQYYGLTDSLPSEAATHEFREILSDGTTYATAIETECTPAEFNESHMPIRDAWSHKLSALANTYRKQFAREKPKCVIVVQGYTPAAATARAAAISLGIPVLAIENTAISTKMLWDNVSGITTNRNLAASHYWRFKDHVTADLANQYCDQLIDRTKSLKQREHTSPPKAFTPSSSRPILLFIGQVYTDSAVTFGLSKWHSPIQAMRESAAWCKRNNFQLVVKLHPKEMEGTSPITGRKYSQLTLKKIEACKITSRLLKENRAIVDENNSLDTYSLIEKCRFAVTVNSQAGLEALIRGKPTVVCGKAFYGNLGFTWDSPDPSLFDSVATCASQSVTSTAARRFAYIFFEKYCVDKTEKSLARIVDASTGLRFKNTFNATASTF